PAPPAAVSKSDVETIARPWIGTPYRYGGYDRGGIDCSALSQNILGDLGATLPRTAESQSMQGWPVGAGGLEAGDLVFFRLGSSRVNHVGVMLDRTRFVHASSSRGVVIDRLMDKYFARNFAGGRRILHGSADGGSE
ncbi:MAG TPA: NlpC/P60 family protein, partial [bacterium]|nr:NlpC/P60 family protein [bacterium]